MSIRKRIENLENRRFIESERCPQCGAENSTYIAIGDDGTETPKCIKCGVERESPAQPVKGYAAGLLEMWP